jgi:hypothetical protein
MENGFNEVTDVDCINVKSKDKLFLIRVPKDVSFPVNLNLLRAAYVTCM